MGLLRTLFSFLMQNTNTNTTGGKGMSSRRVPRRVEINRTWFDVREGWAGKLELYEYMKSPQYTADEPYAHIDNLFFVYDTSGSKVGEFHTDNGSYSGVVNSFEM